MSSIRETQYHCSNCNKVRVFQIEKTKHEDKIKDSTNGIVIYSDIHRCKDGIIGINNLQIDKNYAVR